MEKELSKPPVLSRLSKMSLWSLRRLAEALGVDITGLRRKKEIAERLVGTKCSEIKSFIRFLEVLRRRVSLSHLRRIYQEVFAFPPEDIRALKTITDALIYLYERRSSYAVKEAIEKILSYSNKLRYERPKYTVIVETESPVSFEEIIKRLKDFEDEWNRNNVYRIKIEPLVRKNEMSFTIYEEYAIRVIEEFEELYGGLSVRSELKEPLRHRFIRIRRLSDTRFEVTANYPIDEEVKLGQNLLDTMFPYDKSIEKPDVKLAEDVLRSLSEAIKKTRNAKAFLKCLEEGRERAKKRIRKELGDKDKVKEFLEIVNSIKFAGIYIVKGGIIHFSIESENFDEVLSGVEPDTFHRVIQQLVGIAGESSLQFKLVVNGKSVKIAHNRIQVTGLTKEEERAVKLFLESIGV